MRIDRELQLTSTGSFSSTCLSGLQPPLPLFPTVTSYQHQIYQQHGANGGRPCGLLETPSCLVHLNTQAAGTQICHSQAFQVPETKTLRHVQRTREKVGVSRELGLICRAACHSALSATLCLLAPLTGVCPPSCFLASDFAVSHPVPSLVPLPLLSTSSVCSRQVWSFSFYCWLQSHPRWVLSLVASLM